MITLLCSLLPRKTLINLYKAFTRPHLDYGEIIYDDPSNIKFCQKIESVQYNAALAIKGTIRGTYITEDGIDVFICFTKLTII